MATEVNYAERRGDILRELDGLRAEVDAEKGIGYLILDREPLNIVSYTGRSQICALIEAFDEDDDEISGCSCTAAPSSGAMGWWAMVCLGLVSVSRRRASSQGPRG